MNAFLTTLALGIACKPCRECLKIRGVKSCENVTKYIIAYGKVKSKRIYTREYFFRSDKHSPPQEKIRSRDRCTPSASPVFQYTRLAGDREGFSSRFANGKPKTSLNSP